MEYRCIHVQGTCLRVNRLADACAAVKALVVLPIINLQERHASTS